MSQSSFGRFLSEYKVEGTEQGVSCTVPTKLSTVEGVDELFKSFAGCTFGNGLYRLFSNDDFDKWDNLTSEIFGQFKDSVNCFSHDWMGRVFAWNHERRNVVQLDPSFGEALNIPCNFIELHNIEFVDFPDESLSRKFFDEYRDKNEVKIKPSECVGYKLSPYLGGEDSVNNLAKIDQEVYWSICNDVYSQIDGMD